MQMVRNFPKLRVLKMIDCLTLPLQQIRFGFSFKVSIFYVGKAFDLLHDVMLSQKDGIYMHKEESSQKILPQSTMGLVFKSVAGPMPWTTKTK